MLQRGGAITERVALRAAELEQNVEGLASKIRNTLVQQRDGSGRS